MTFKKAKAIKLDWFESLLYLVDKIDKPHAIESMNHNQLKLHTQKPEDHIILGAKTLLLAVLLYEGVMQLDTWHKRTSEKASTSVKDDNVVHARVWELPQQWSHLQSFVSSNLVHEA